MTGREFLKASEYFLKRREEEMLRSAISRSYYALFHESRAFLNDLQFPYQHLCALDKIGGIRY